MSCPHHEFVPLLTRARSDLGWERQLTLPPRYPFQCQNCNTVEWVTLDLALERGWVLEMKIGDPG